MSTVRSAPPLAERYGRAHPQRRLIATVLLGLGVLTAGAWLVWTAWFHGRPEVTSQLVGFSVVSDTEISVTFDVAIGEPGVEATCRARALSADKDAVGDLVVTVPDAADGTDTEGGRVQRTFRTLREATAVDLIGCTTPDQRRAR